MERGRELAREAAGSLPARVGKKFLRDGGPKQATVIAWNTLLAMFPIVLTAVTLLGFVIHFAGLSPTSAYTDLLGFLPASARPKPSDLAALQRQAGLLGVISLLGLVWSGAALFGAMEEAFALVYETRPRHFVRQKLVGVAMILLFTVLGGLATLTSTLLPLVQNMSIFPGALRRGPAALVLQFAFGAIAGVVLFGLIYYIVPNRRQRLRQVWPGALLAGILFEVVTLLFPTYIAINHGFNRYGSEFALLFLLMSFVYFVGMITMFGAELNSVLYPVKVTQPRPATVGADGGGAERPLNRPAGPATAGP